MKAVFMGTPDFAVPTLQKMIDMGIEVTAVVTQPDNVLWPMIFRFISRFASERSLNLFRHCVICSRM